LNGDDWVVDAVSWGNQHLHSILHFASPGRSFFGARPANLDNDSAMDWQDQPVPHPGQVDLTIPTGTPTLTQTSTQTPTITRTPTETLELCGAADLLVTELLYDPLDSTDPDGEWLEIYNPGNSQVNLACIKVGDEETQGGGEGLLRFPNGAHLAGGEVLVVANRPARFLYFGICGL
jgi:hypothetical protein